MATQARVTVVMRDSYGKTTRRSYTPRDPMISDADALGLAEALQDITALSVVGLKVTRDIGVSGISTPAVALSSRQKDASIVYTVSELRQSHGGTYTFNLPEPKAALVAANGTLVLGANEFELWREYFDDGAGIAGLVGVFFVSDQEELVEDAVAIDGFFNKD